MIDRAHITAEQLISFVLSESERRENPPSSAGVDPEMPRLPRLPEAGADYAWALSMLHGLDPRGWHACRLLRSLQVGTSDGCPRCENGSQFHARTCYLQTAQVRVVRQEFETPEQFASWVSEDPETRSKKDGYVDVAKKPRKEDVGRLMGISGHEVQELVSAVYLAVRENLAAHRERK